MALILKYEHLLLLLDVYKISLLHKVIAPLLLPDDTDQARSWRRCPVGESLSVPPLGGGVKSFI